MKNSYRANDNMGVIPAGMDAVTRYLKAKDLELLEDDDVDLDVIPEIRDGRRAMNMARS